MDWKADIWWKNKSSFDRTSVFFLFIFFFYRFPFSFFFLSSPRSFLLEFEVAKSLFFLF
jgi:hypothetical protein